MLIKCLSRPILRTHIEIPNLNYRVQANSNQPLILAQHLSYLVVVCVKRLDYGAAEKWKKIDLVIEAREGKRLRCVELGSRTDAALSYEVRLHQLQLEIEDFDEAVVRVG